LIRNPSDLNQTVRAMSRVVGSPAVMRKLPLQLQQSLQ
jgi:hypothetical protein